MTMIGGGVGVMLGRSGDSDWWWWRRNDAEVEW